MAVALDQIGSETVVHAAYGMAYFEFGIPLATDHIFRICINPDEVERLGATLTHA